MLSSMIAAFSMYSRIPMPRIPWDEKSTRYAMCFFPAVGAVIGLCCAGCYLLLEHLGMGQNVIAAVLTALPILISGGIHMDGFLDTMDAKSSWKPMQDRLNILKDPHTGAFAVIYAILYFLVSYAFFGEARGTQIGWIAAGYVYSRILSALSVVTLKKARRDGMVAASADVSPKNVKWILTAELLGFAAAVLWINPVMGALCLLCGIAVFVYYRSMSYRVFGGITGDLAGYFLQVCELMWLIVAVLAGKGGVL